MRQNGIPDETRLIQWLRLSLLPGFGPASMDRLQTRFEGGLQDLFSLDDSALMQLGLKPTQITALRRTDWAKVEAFLAWQAAHPSHVILCRADARYPEQLRQIRRAPLLLFAQGNTALLASPQLAMVGSRAPTPSGARQAELLASQLADCGWTITSGLAIGVDGCSHRGALSAGGHTIAVLGSGIDHIYPRRHQRLAEQICQQNGLLLSEFYPGVAPLAENFPRRNRVVSGLSLGTLVVEAAVKSGSLITAHYALEQNREVFAMPGSVNNPLSAGCHYLIKQGAKLVASIEDINEEFQMLSFLNGHEAEKNLEKSRVQSLASDRLLDSVDYEATSLDVVVQRSKLPIKEVLAQLLEYELRGLVATVPGGYIKLGEK